ncbi:MAG: SIMPL domain-containing protein [Candidatus Methanomethylophilaceae archaeon]
MGELRTIRIIEGAENSVASNITNVSISVDRKGKVYRDVIETGTKEYDDLIALVGRIAGDRARIVTRSMRIEPTFEDVRRNDGHVKVFTGYRLTRVMNITFANDVELLGNLLSTISGCGYEPSVSVNNVAEDIESATMRTLKDAAENARVKAEAIAESLGVKLGRIVSVNRPPTSERMVARCYSAGHAEPESTTVEEEIEVVWEII